MNVVRSFLLIVEVLCSLMLIGLILLQKSKGGGLGTAFGGGGGDSMFGSRTGNVLTKATIVLGLVFLLNTLVLGIMFSRKVARESELDRELMQETSEQQVGEESPAPLPAAEQPEEQAAPVPGSEGAPEESANMPAEVDKSESTQAPGS